MDVVGSVSAILSIAAAGAQCSFKLVSFVSQIKGASESISNAAEDVSITANILQQLGDLIQDTMEEQALSERLLDREVAVESTATSSANPSRSQKSILNETALDIVLNLGKKCSDIFASLNLALQNASQQLSARPRTKQRVKLTHKEMLKWPFLQPDIKKMRDELANIRLP
ncbi:uncharacterized protein N7446_003981 [Penicillium canescens]|uniref:Fungal N-terminal domain-containing protein n=1 Tax=Penicillium canescens TaxID=5083 RepID=A0AAD6I215_PENCN|nr:uncharacterized protein N7446_003981 [Penicillium canescens]KAJ6027425.1 hypothetical protein N7460_012242 [Penicillium canescens]KAJ6040703.1 hypothetical protein N7444_009608 [Penicillium canescens]KAJ6066944.1 hypothetical protein N7446_003981 [Penicillium canescens]